jgi:hypothetical protein
MMPELSRNAQVLRYLLQVAPGVGHTKLAKFAYLADLEARKYLGHPISDLRYVLDQHGPFDSRGFFKARDELVAGGYITETPLYFGSYLGFEMVPTSKAPEYGFSAAEVEVLSYVAKTFLNKTAIALCEDVVYKTEPMERVKKKMGERLPMDEMNRDPKDEQGFNLDRMLDGEADAKAGRVRQLVDVMNELRARAH